MRKEKYFYNTHTLRYEKAEVSLQEKILKIIGIFSVVVVSAFFFTFMVWKLFPSPSEQAKANEIKVLQDQLKSKEAMLDQLALTVDKIQERDKGVHRMILGMNPIDENIWNGGVGGSDRYSNYRSLGESGNMLVRLQQKADKLKWKLAKQSESLDTISQIALDKEKEFSSIPSIKPIREDKLARNIKLLSGFGYRMHPIHKVRKMHKGIDFTAPKGTSIQATGNGKVVRVEKKRSGYGHNVIIDHGFGYKTLYAHMSKIDVKKGQKVKKGEHIGAVGDTGTSTAAHLHYEVIYKGKKVNPIDYCLDGLSPKEYDELLKLAEVSNQSLD